MSDSLSAEQIAKLFAEAKEGSLPDGAQKPAQRTRSIRTIDFSHPTMLSLAEQKRFERAHATFCKDASERLASEVHAMFELEVINSSQLTWKAALDDVPHPSLLAVAECAPGQAILMTIEEPLLLRMAESLLGGGYVEGPLAREMTEVDLALSRHVFERLLSMLSSVWQDLLGLELKLVKLGLNDSRLESMPAIQPTLELTIEARDQNSSSTILLLVPDTAIEAAHKSLGHGAGMYSEMLAGEDAGDIGDALGAARVEVRAEVGEATLTIREVLGLTEGDVVKLGPAEGVGVSAGDIRLHRARPGLSGARRAVQIVERQETLS